MRRYARSEKGKAATRRYNSSAKGKEAKRRYFQSERGKAALRRYLESPKGKAARARYQHKLRVWRLARRIYRLTGLPPEECLARAEQQLGKIE